MSVWIWICYLVLGWWLPWWSLPLAAAGVGYFSQNKISLVYETFCGGFLIWLSLILFFDLRAQNLVGASLARLMSLPAPWALTLILSLYAGLVALAFGALGFWLKRCIRKPYVSR